MKDLLVDLGNSRIKLAWAGAEGIDFLGSFGDYGAALDVPRALPDRVWLSSVADSKSEGRLRELLRERWDCPVREVSVARYAQHLPTRYAADQLGVDRWLAMLACRGFCAGAFLVVDCGTAITLDQVDGQGVHVGGYILPGFPMMQAALLDGTSITLRAARGPDAALPCDTAAAISRGSRTAVAALIERMARHEDAGLRIFLGGGDAAALAPLLPITHDIVGQLVLLGLSRLSRLENN